MIGRHLEGKNQRRGYRGMGQATGGGHNHEIGLGMTGSPTGFGLRYRHLFTLRPFLVSEMVGCGNRAGMALAAENIGKGIRPGK